MKKKSRLRLEIKGIAEDGSFEGILSPYGNVDGGGDVVEPGAYTKTLKEGGATRPLLWQHKTDQPIGQLTLEDRPDGLWCKGQLLMELPKAKDAYLVIKARIIKGLSIGFESIKDSIESGVRHLKEIKLYEGSIVTFPMNDFALITSVKGSKQAGDEAEEDFNAELAEIQLQDAGYQMMCALRSALAGSLYGNLTKDEIISLSQVICQQFTEAYMAYLPTYLDFIEEEYGGMEIWNKKRIEVKQGATFSAATKSAMQTACSMIKSGHDSLLALVSAEAGTATSDEKAAKSEKSEPEVDHSAAETLSKSLDGLRALIPA